MEIPQAWDPILVAHRESMLELTYPFNAMLTGSNLLAKVKEMGDASKSDLVRACGPGLALYYIPILPRTV